MPASCRTRNSNFSHVRRVALVAMMILASLLKPSADAYAQTNQNTQQLIGQILGAIISEAIQNGAQQAARDDARKSWQALDPIADLCLRRNYGIDSDQLSQAGIGATDQRIWPYVEHCMQYAAEINQDTAAQALQLTIPGYREDPTGTYTRTSAGLKSVGSKYIFRDTVAEAGSDNSQTLLNGVNQKVRAACAGEYSASEYVLHSANDPNSSELGIQGPWMAGAFDCSAERADAETPSGMIIDQMTKSMTGDAYVDLHTVTLNASYEDAFAAIKNILAKDGDPVVRADSDKGIIATGEPANWNVPYYEQFFIVLDPDNRSTTAMTFKLFASTRDASRPTVVAFMLEDEDTVNHRAEKFIAAVEQALKR